MKEKLGTYHIAFEDMKFVPKQDTEMNPEAIKKIKSFQERLAFNSIRRFRRSAGQAKL